MEAHYLDPDELERALAEVRASPADEGRLEAIVARPATDERRRLEAAHLSPERGLEGDRWAGAGEPADQQVSMMNARLLRQLAGEKPISHASSQTSYGDYSAVAGPGGTATVNVYHNQSSPISDRLPSERLAPELEHIRVGVAAQPGYRVDSHGGLPRRQGYAAGKIEKGAQHYSYRHPLWGSCLVEGSYE